MKIIIKAVLILIGILLVIDAIWLLTVSNVNMGVLGTLGLGILLLLLGFFLDRMKQITQKRFAKIIKYIIIILFSLWFALLSFIAIYGNIDTATYKEDAVLVLGCGIRGKNVSLVLAYRLDKAVEYYNKNPNAIFIVSGGQGPQEDITEAEAMKEYLINKGIPSDKIIKEEKATSTTENVQNSKRILDEKFDKDYKIAIITNNFHIYRATQIATKNGLNCTHYNAQIRFDTIAPNYIRETMGVAKYWILGQ